MQIKSLSIHDFRNIEQADFYASPGINFFEGLNGQGKTSILEAITLLTSLGSFRTHHLGEIIRQGQTSTWVTGKITDSDHVEFETELKVALTSQAGLIAPRKAAWVNGHLHRTASSYLAQRHNTVQLGVHSVIFNPTDHDLVRGAPNVRRAYLDRVVSAEDLDHLESLRRYQKALQQRNRILKEGGSAFGAEAISFETVLISEGARIALRRVSWLHANESLLWKFLEKIAPAQPAPGLSYLSPWVASSVPLDLSEYLTALSHAFQKSRARENLAGVTLAGPHRDDWDFKLGQSHLRAVGSQGEIRSVLLALKLTEVSAFSRATSQKPVLLLDDFSSELDLNRRAFLLENLTQSGIQIFVTATEAPLRRFAEFFVENGKIRQNRSVEEPNFAKNQLLERSPSQQSPDQT